MTKYLLPVWILLLVSLSLNAIQAAQEAEIVAYAIAAEIQTGQPIFLDLQCGEWTSALTQQLTRILLSQKADLRVDNSDTDTIIANSDEVSNSVKLADYGLDSALLVQVSLNLKWQEKVQRNFFSYHSERSPVYSFETKQIQLPKQQVLKLSTYDFFRPHSADTGVSRLRLRWFEPLVAGAAIASMVFLLWNFD